MFKLIKNIGCLAIIILAGWFFYGVYSDIENAESSRPAHSAVDNSRQPDADIVEMMFSRADRDHLREKYGPKANVGKSGTPRVGNHRDGWFYIHEYVGRDELGRTVQEYSGMLYKTNSATAWTYYAQDALADILPEVTVNGQPLPNIPRK
jgi:hypothetical protein